MHTFTFDASYDYSGAADAIEVPLTLFANGKSHRVTAKVDTGASYCVFQRRFAEHLGIDLSGLESESWATVAGRFEVYPFQVTMECLESRFDLTVYFAASPTFPRNVVGRNGWLAQFRIAIIDHDSQLFASPYDG